MMAPSQPPTSDPKSALDRHGLTPKYSFGQNFLADRKLLERIVEVASPGPERWIMELGAGLGALTRVFLERGDSVIAVERDRDLVSALEIDFAAAIGRNALRVVAADAKALDVETLLEGLPPKRTLAGNLPYQITGPLLRRAVQWAGYFDRTVFLVQLEVADRAAAMPGTASYGALSVFLQACFTVRREFVVRRGAFFPQPRVDSAVVLFTPRPDPIAETELFRDLVQRAFGQRRKKLKNVWNGVAGLTGGALEQVAQRAGIDLSERGERLAASQFAAMEKELRAWPVG